MTGPHELFPVWHSAQRTVDRHAREAPPSPRVLRTTGQLRPELAERVADWFTLGVGFDLQSEFATWLQCRTLLSREARPAAFCELVGAVTAYVMTGSKPGLRAKLPPSELLA
jgi:hypothetical protein